MIRHDIAWEQLQEKHEAREEILKRLVAATGPDRELDCLIHNYRTGDRAYLYGTGFRSTNGTGATWAVNIPEITRSLDAALWLLPTGRLWSIGCVTNGSGFVATLSHMTKSQRGATAALALLTAIFTAESMEK